MTSRTSGRGAVAAALVVAVPLVVLAAMIVVPPWSMAMLPVALVGAELSPLVALAALVWLLATRWLMRGHHRLGIGVGAPLIAAALLSLWPLARYDAAADRASAQLADGAPPARYSLVATMREFAGAVPVRERAIRCRAGDGTPLVMRLYRGADVRARPTVVALYGGAWRGGDASQGASVNRALVAHGFTVVAIDYRHAPRFHFPAQLDDVRRSLALLRDSASAWGIDTTRLALLGRSSGGHLAELGAYTPGALAVRAVVAIYAPHDLVEGYRDLPSPDPIGVRGVLRDFLGGTPDDAAEQYARASPASYVRGGLPPTLLLYGGRDHIVKPEFNRRAATTLRAAGVHVVDVEIPWAEHGFDMVPGGLGAQLALNASVRFLDRWIGGA